MQIKELKIIDKKFIANGNEYFITEKISIARYVEYQKLSPLLTFGTSFAEIFQQLKNAYNHLNKQNFADSSVIIHNILSNVAKVETDGRMHPALRMAALFINRKGEDLTIYDEQVIIDKIEDWAKEGYSMSDFFSLSLSSINGFREAFQEYTEKNLKINEG